MNKIEVHPKKESKSLEFKAKLPNFQSLIKTCIAFANGSGGRIVIGVEDNTRKPQETLFFEKRRDPERGMP